MPVPAAGPASRSCVVVRDRRMPFAVRLVHWHAKSIRVATDRSGSLRGREDALRPGHPRHRRLSTTAPPVHRFPPTPVPPLAPHGEPGPHDRSPLVPASPSVRALPRASASPSASRPSPCRRALASASAVGRPAPRATPRLRPAAPDRRRPVPLAAGAAASGGAAVRRARRPRTAPATAASTSAAPADAPVLCRGRRRGGVRRAAGRPRRGVGRPSERPAHHLRAAGPRGQRRRSGWRPARCSATCGRATPAARRVPALGRAPRRGVPGSAGAGGHGRVRLLPWEEVG